jgi:hypothetical protein
MNEEKFSDLLLGRVDMLFDTNPDSRWRPETSDAKGIKLKNIAFWRQCGGGFQTICARKMKYFLLKNVNSVQLNGFSQNLSHTC